MRLGILVVIAVVVVAVSGQQLNEWEQLLIAQPNPGRLYEHLAFYTSRPHIAGTPEDLDTALYTQEALKRAGVVDARIETASVLLTYPISRSLSIVEPSDQRFTAALQEKAIPEDPTSYDERQIMTHNAYSASGNVTAKLVYVNYGRIEDFEELERQGISVRGSIVLVRYGQIFRGNKVFHAQLAGAVGCIIYSDPADDGFSQGAVYPEGPWRPETGVQRGSTAFLALCPGDPGKISRCGGINKTTPSIPVLPISYGDAEPFLRGLTGPNVPIAWQGGLPFTYKIGPGPIVVNLQVSMSFEQRTIWNVIGEIKGQQTNRKVIIGNHRDAWNFGAVDPNSGTSTMLELARSFGVLLQNGWQPKRTLQFGSWDAEEYALIGSTEFGETNAASLSTEAIAYLNVDTAVQGSTFRAGATPSLFGLIRDASQNVTDPKTGQSLYSVWNRQVGILGSGSDYSVFLDKLGIACTDMGFSSGNGVYHSVYDSLSWMTKFGDPGFAYHKALTQLWALMTIRLLDSTILPFDFVETAANLKTYLQTINQLLRDQGGEGQVDIELIAEDIAAFETAAGAASRAVEFCSATPSPCTESENNYINDVLFTTERKFLISAGLPKRPWFKNSIFGPGYRTGYEGNVFPGVVDAIYDKNWALAEQQAEVLGDAIREAAEHLLQLNTPKRFGRK